MAIRIHTVYEQSEKYTSGGCTHSISFAVNSANYINISVIFKGKLFIKRFVLFPIYNYR